MHGLLTCKDVGNGILNYEKGAFKHLWGAVEGVGQFANTLGEWMIADSLYEMGDTSYFHAKSQASLDDWKAFGSAFATSPIRTSGKMLAPGVMAALDSPTSAEAWGRAGVDIGLLALSFTKIGQIRKLGAVESKAFAGSRAGRAAEELSLARKAKPGEFNIIDWKGYPDRVPKPQGPFRLVEGVEYDIARKAANTANNKMRKTNNLRGLLIDIHEVKPVKFGGSPINPGNKVILDRNLHRQQVTP